MLVSDIDRFASDADNEAVYRQAAARVIQWRREHRAMSQAQFADPGRPDERLTYQCDYWREATVKPPKETP